MKPVTSSQVRVPSHLFDVMHFRTRHGEHVHNSGTGWIRRGSNTRAMSCGLSTASTQVNIHSWFPRFFQSLRGPGRRAIRDSLAKTQRTTCNFLQQKAGIVPKHDLGHKLVDHHFRLKQQTGQTMAERSIRSDEVYQRLLSASERATGKRTKIQMCPSEHWARSGPHRPPTNVATIPRDDDVTTSSA